MRLKRPRIEPLQEAEFTQEQRDFLAPIAARGPVLNVRLTLVRAYEAVTGFRALGAYVLSDQNSLVPRDREILVLRTGFLCRSGYEWVHHVEFGTLAGLSPEEIERVKLGAEAVGWSPAETTLIRAADELHADQFISDTTWAALRGSLSERQCMDVIFTVGHYTHVCMALNTFGVQLEPGYTLDPDVAAF